MCPLQDRDLGDAGFVDGEYLEAVAVALDDLAQVGHTRELL